VGIYAGGGLETYYSHGPGVDEPLAQATGSDVAYLHWDGLGSITALSSPTGELSGSRSYTAFGRIDAASGMASRYGFSGREKDATGLSYHRSRYYQPEVGRFVSRDAFAGVATMPQSLHDYTYTHNDPVNRVDPFGDFAGKDDLYRAFFNFMLLYGLAITLVGVGVENLTGDDGVLRFGLDLYQNLLIAAIIFTLIERYGAAIWARARALVAGLIASLQELPRTGHVTNPVGKTAIVVVYVIIRFGVAASKGFAVSGASLLISIKNIADFWRTGNIAELAKGPNQGML
jgi:RHS repeat-associated protein